MSPTPSGGGGDEAEEAAMEEEAPLALGALPQGQRQSLSPAAPVREAAVPLQPLSTTMRTPWIKFGIKGDIPFK